MPLKLIKIMLAGVLAGHLLKANRIRSTARLTGFVQLRGSAGQDGLCFLQRLSFSGLCLSMRGRGRRN